MLSVYRLEQAEQWDAAVRSFENYDTYYLSGYVRAFQLHGDGEPLLFYYESDTVRGINVVMKRDIADCPHFKGILKKNTFFDFSTPYGYGGWLIEGGNPDALISAYTDWCRKNRIISEFVRFHPMLKNHENVVGHYEVVPLGEVVAIDLESPEVVWSNLISQNRNKVRKAQKNGIVIYHGRYPEIYETFRDIYNKTMDKDHADPYYYFAPVFYESILQDLPQNAQVFYAAYEGKIIAASIMLTCNGKMNYHLSGSLQEYAHLAPVNLLLYQAALWGCVHGCRSLYLGGGVGSGEDSLFKFKKAFYRGSDLPRFHIGKKIFDPDTYAALVEMRGNLPNSNFFPAYRS